MIAAITRAAWALACRRVVALHDAELHRGWRELEGGTLTRAEEHFARASHYADWLRRHVGRTR